MNQLTDGGTPERRDRGAQARAVALGHAILKFPFRLGLTILKRIAQVLFSIFILILHPGYKWLIKLLTRSAFVQKYIRPALQKIAERYFDPYFAFLGSLPPYWATFSIALPLAFLEPAKLYATILIVEHPKTGVLLWLLLHGLSFVLIERTWTAVRPQSRKIWLVSRIHAWAWLNWSYGKYWITSSLFYKTLVRWRKQVWAATRAFWAQLMARLHRAGIH
jgi:hypothetical protein